MTLLQLGTKARVIANALALAYIGYLVITGKVDMNTAQGWARLLEDGAFALLPSLLVRTGK